VIDSQYENIFSYEIIFSYIYFGGTI